MIIVRAPLRISFVGGGTDLPDFYRHNLGKVISVTIDKYVYVAINPAPLLKGITARYAINEHVLNIRDLKNDRIRETILHFGIKDPMEIGSFAHLPVGIGLGGSSSFTVALVKGLSTYLGKRLSDKEIAEIACKIEIDYIKEPIGKQDQYATACGGINVYQFNADETVNIEPVLLDYKKRMEFENHMLIFFTGISRKASTVLTEQKTNISNKTEVLEYMASLVDIFKNHLLKGDFKSMGLLLHENWIKKKTLSSNISNQEIDQIYNVGISSGAWGGKVLGAGGGGCIMFLAPFGKIQNIRTKIVQKFQSLKLDDFKEVPVKFVQSGVEVVSNSYFS